jgi:hypothetical protein
LPKRIAVLLVGNDLSGESFLEETHTVDLSRDGVALVSRRKLALEQEVMFTSSEPTRRRRRR